MDVERRRVGSRPDCATPATTRDAGSHAGPRATAAHLAMRERDTAPRWAVYGAVAAVCGIALLTIGLAVGIILVIVHFLGKVW
jgi:hypothetical protein